MYNQYDPYNQYNQMPMPVRQRRPRSWPLGCGCLLVVLAALIGLGAGVVLTTGRTHMIFLYVAAGIIALLLLLVVLSMLFTRGGREALAEGCADGCLEAIFGFLGG